jgi:hypothetical protein
VTYWTSSGSSVRPNVSRSDSIASGFSSPLKRANMVFTGSPGMSRGMKKFSVIATQAASA